MSLFCTQLKFMLIIILYILIKEKLKFLFKQINQIL